MWKLRLRLRLGLWVCSWQLLWLPRALRQQQQQQMLLLLFLVPVIQLVRALWGLPSSLL